ncbi:hypothetical protein [Endozoicomonas arenosclerae]|uniref:hypothetical protein n=1 Tax=Endozoicomonas arenosclerae TaxID=1633495 RepID=UPI0007809FEE|nr:hypothetical protein [Endozoicomonas arenosclerae]
MATGNEMGTSPPPPTVINVAANQFAQATANALVKTAGEVAVQAGERAKRTFMGLSVDSFRVPNFIKEKFNSIGTSKTWKSIKKYCVRINESWGTVARWGMGGALAGGYLFGSTVGAAFGMGIGSAAGLYFAANTWSDTAKQQEQAELDAAKLKKYQEQYGDINPYEGEIV